VSSFLHSTSLTFLVQLCYKKRSILLWLGIWIGDFWSEFHLHFSLFYHCELFFWMLLMILCFFFWFLSFLPASEEGFFLTSVLYWCLGRGAELGKQWVFYFIFVIKIFGYGDIDCWIWFGSVCLARKCWKRKLHFFFFLCCVSVEKTRILKSTKLGLRQLFGVLLFLI
jgi:hypothetical protein